MQINWSMLPQLLFTWKYLFFLLFAIAGWALLLRGRPMRRSRLLLQGLALLSFGGLLGLVLPWASRAFGLHPSPMCAFGKGFAIPVLYGKIGLPMLLLIATVILLTFIGAKAFCGWACPLGALQELVGRIPGLKRYRLPFAWTNGIRTLAMVLFFVVLFRWSRISYDYFNPFEFFHWRHLSQLAVWGPMAVVIVASLFVYRPFCSLICPIGLLSWLVERVSLGRVRVGSACNDCGLCAVKTDCQAMPALVKGERIVPDCHGCGDCLGLCPKEAIRFSWKRSF